MIGLIAENASIESGLGLGLIAVWVDWVRVRVRVNSGMGRLGQG